MTEGRMLEYIREQPQAVAKTRRVCQPGIVELQRMWDRKPPKHVIVAGLGSSYTAAQMASTNRQRAACFKEIPSLRSFSFVPCRDSLRSSRRRERVHNTFPIFHSAQSCTTPAWFCTSRSKQAALIARRTINA